MDAREISKRDPFQLFAAWMREAEQSEPNDPNAVALATASADGAPSVRMVLVKIVDDRGFCFFSNGESQKGTQLAENPRAAMCFHWKTLRRQIRIEGPVTELPGQAADEYFHSRSRRSQLGAAVSDQSRVLRSRAELEDRVRRFSDEHPGELPRPEYWRGYRLDAKRIEFWIEGKDRLHDRFLFVREVEGWSAERLYP